MDIIKPFKELKRIASQFIETEFRYRFRSVTNPYYHDEKKKFVWNKFPARDYLTSTWNGDMDILEMMLLKVEHQFYNLKKYACQSYFYIDTPCLESESDKAWAAKKIIELFDICRAKKDDYYRNQYHEEWWSDLRGDGKKKKRSSRYCYFNFINRIPIANIDNQLYYLVHSDEFDGFGYVVSWSIDSEDGKISMAFPSCSTFSDIEKSFEKLHNVKINIVDGLLSQVMSIDVDIVKDYNRLSDDAKSHCRGIRRTLVELLRLRHYLKKAINLSDTDDKYFNMWANIEDPDEREKKLYEAMNIYREDRKSYYKKIFELMEERGDTWWD